MDTPILKLDIADRPRELNRRPFHYEVQRMI